MNEFNFIDLFSGIGGFHIALESLGGKCVFASEVDSYAIETYQKNFGLDCNQDIRLINPETLPDYDMMCAGFPCQTFSKAGSQKGFEEIRGTLFFDMVRLLKYRLEKGNPVKFIFFENVRNLVSHDRGNTYRIIMDNLKKLGYITNEKPIIASPHHIGVPQLRERAFILGVHEKYAKAKERLLFNFEWKGKRNSTSAYAILEEDINGDYRISNYEELVLDAWNEFYQGITEDVIGFPIWSEFFTSASVEEGTPKWKADFIMRNQRLYQRNKTFVDQWLMKHNYLKDFVKTHRKFEWQCGTDCKSIWEGIIQFRPSGIRVKRPTEYPALVAMAHIPIVGKFKRRLTPREVANLQSFPKTFKINTNDKQAYKQFGNSVNIEIIRILGRELLKNSDHVT